MKCKNHNLTTFIVTNIKINSLNTSFAKLIVLHQLTFLMSAISTLEIQTILKLKACRTVIITAAGFIVIFTLK